MSQIMSYGLLMSYPLHLIQKILSKLILLETLFIVISKKKTFEIILFQREHKKFIKNNQNLEVVNGEEINKPATKVLVQITELQQALRESFPDDAQQFQEETKSALADLNFQGIISSNKQSNQISLDPDIEDSDYSLDKIQLQKKLEQPPKQFEQLDTQEKFEEFIDQYENCVQELRVKYLNSKKFLSKLKKKNEMSECLEEKPEKDNESEEQKQQKSKKINERFKGQFLSTLEEKEAIKQQEKKVQIKQNKVFIINAYQRKKVLKSCSKPQNQQNKMYSTDQNFFQQTETIDTNENSLNSTSTFQDFNPNNKRKQLLQLKTDFQKYKQEKDDELFNQLLQNPKILRPQNYNPKSILKAVSQQKYLTNEKIERLMLKK